MNNKLKRAIIKRLDSAYRDLCQAILLMDEHDGVSAAALSIQKIKERIENDHSGTVC